MAVVMIALDGCFLDRPVHAFNLAIGPGMFDLGEAVFDPVFFTSHVEHMGDVGSWRAVSVARRKRELDAVVRQHGVDFVWDCCDQRDQDGGGRAPVRLAHELDEDELAGAVDRHVQVQLALRRSHRGDVDVKVANGGLS